MNFRRQSRLYSLLLLPLLFALFSSDKTLEFDEQLDDEGIVLELDLPEERRVPTPNSGDGVPSASDGSASIRGRVVDEKSSEPIEGVEVALPELDRRVVTGADGRYAIDRVPPRLRPYEVLLSKPGYKSSFEDLRAEEGTCLRRDFGLEPVAW